MIIALQMLIFFRESVLAILNGWLPPFFRQLVGKLSRGCLVAEEDETEEHVYADYDDECGVVFFPPVYAQRYAAVCDCLMDERWCGKLEKVLNIGKQHDIHFLKYLTEVPGINQILGLDIECSWNCTCDMVDLLFDDYEQLWEKPMQITLLQGNAADPDYRLIGCDAVIAIDLIEQLLPHDLDRLVHNVFGFIKPWVALFTTSNADFNHLIKNLDKNGLRQSNHYFEWTRAQLHDWCSNIVGRYPEYMVVSRGVGPGPVGTSHYGCFSQLVLFISKGYKKELELNVNSLVLVPSLPEPDQVNDIGWLPPSEVPSLRSMAHALEEVESMELHFPDSSLGSSASPTPVPSEPNFQRVDKSSQCNLDVELGRSFVMYNYEDLYEVRMPRKRIYRTVYEIGDVANRLNNTMYEVKQFSKTTQSLIEKNELDTLNTQDVMEEISHLSDMLALYVSRNGGEGHTWNNVNWGENVPYWNQYYKVVGVYDYPYEGKSEDDIILDLLSVEINKLLEMQGVGGASRQGNQFEIPIEHLMKAVSHITDDVNRVTMLMEDNGYDLDGEAVVHSNVDLSVAALEEEIDSVSNGSTLDMDINGHVLNRILGRKVKKLQLLLQNDEDLRKVLGQVICRLKKIALSCGVSKDGPAKTRWLQCKLLELLTMKEKSIVRKKLRNKEHDAKDLIRETGDDTFGHLARIKAEDDKAMKIVQKYQNILRKSSDTINDVESEYEPDKPLTCKFVDGPENRAELENCSNELVHDSDDLSKSPASDESMRYTKTETKTEPVAEQQSDRVTDSEVTDMSLYQGKTNESKVTKSDDAIPIKHSNSKHIKSRHESKVKANIRLTKKNKTSSSNNIICSKRSKHNDIHRMSLVTVKNITKNTSSYKALDRTIISGATPERVVKKLTFDNRLDCHPHEPTFVLSVKPKPIPDDIFELCHADLIRKSYRPVQKTNALWDSITDSPVSVTQDSHVIEILTQDETVTVALERTVGTNPDEDSEIYEYELELLNRESLLTVEPSDIAGNVTSSVEDRFYKITLNEEITCVQELNGPWHGPTNLVPPPSPVADTEKAQIVEILTQDECEIVALQRSVATEPDVVNAVYEQELGHAKLTNSLNEIPSHAPGDVSSQEIFLYDINEPTTSKGLRHVSMDVQCGTDAKISFSATTSFTAPLNMFGTGLKIGDSVPDVRAITKTDCVTSTHDILKPCGQTSFLWMKSVGIKIKDSCHQIGHSLPKDEKEKETDIAPRPINNVDNCINTTPKNSMEIVSPIKPIGDCDGLAKKNKGSVSTLGSSAINTKRSTYPTRQPRSIVIKMKESNIRAPKTKGAVTRFLRQPNELQPKLSCGGVHVHSYKDLQVSEDVMYQGEWQRYRQKPPRRSLTYYHPKKIVDSATDKTKFARKANVTMKPQRLVHGAVQGPKTFPVTIRNTKASKMKEEIIKMNMQNKIVPAKTQQNPARSKVIPKVTSKSTTNYSKPIKERSKIIIQPNRQSKAEKNSIAMKENKNLSSSARNLCTSPNLHKISKKRQVQKIPSKPGIKTDSLLNLLRKQPIPSNVDKLITALLKVSVEPPKPVNYMVYRNESDSAKCSTTIDKVPVSALTNDSENVLRSPMGSLSRESSFCSWRNSVLNPQPVSKTKSLKSIITIAHKVSDNKKLSRLKKLVNTMISSKKTPLDIPKLKIVPGTSTLAGPTSKQCAYVDFVVGTTNNVFAANKPASKPSVTRSFVKSSDSKTESSTSDKSNKHSKIADSKAALVLDPCITKVDTQSVDSQSLNKDTDSMDNCVVTAADNKSIFDAMKELVEESLYFIDALDTRSNRDADIADLGRSDFENIASAESEAYESGSSFRRTFDIGSASLTQSLTDCSFKSVPSASKTSECFADSESWNNASPSCDYVGNVQDTFERKGAISITQVQKPTGAAGFSTLAMNAHLSQLAIKEQKPDYVNLVDSETGSYATCALNRRATSEEVLVSGHSSESYVSCVLDEDAVIPSWLFHGNNQQASGSNTSTRQGVPVHPEVVVEMPEPFALGYDENGNELAAHGAGAGDGHGIHSDQSQDSSGRDTSFSSSATSSGVQSESIAVDPGTYVEQFETMSELVNGSNAPVMFREELNDTSFISAIENPSSPNRDRIPRSTHRVSLPASDADVSSIDTDVASDN